MAQYTKLLESEVHALAHEYGLELTGCTPITGGAANSSYLLNNGDKKFILTVCETSLTLVNRMSKLLRLLAEHGFPAPRIKPLSNSKQLTSYQGKPVFLKPYITGQVVQNLTSSQLKQIGTTMAQLHEIPAPDYLSGNHMYITETYPCVLATGRDQSYLNWLRQRYKFLTKKIPSNLPKGLIHGDLFFDNILFEGDRLKAFLDFEEVCHSYKLFDVGMAVVGFYTNNITLHLDKIRAFINGYQTIRVLTQEEKEKLKLFVELTALLTSAWRYWKYHLDVPDPAKAQKHLQMVNIANEISALPQFVWMQAIFS